MDSSHLTGEQVLAVHATVGRQLRYLNRLCSRMQSLRFPPADPLCVAAHAARNALQDLYTAAHYAQCASGTVGK